MADESGVRERDADDADDLGNADPGGRDDTDHLDGPDGPDHDGRGPRRWIGVAVAVVLALAVGYVAGLLTPSLRTPGDASAEAGFARDMSTHHAQAVQMAMVAYQRATTPEVRQIAYDIATTQENQIGIMHTWLDHWGDSINSTNVPMSWMPDGSAALDNGLMPGMATPAQLNQLQAATGRNVDVLFCQLMLRHHLGGLHMVEGILASTHNGEVRDLAIAMKNGQSGEVTRLRELLTGLGAQPL
jgi:uncharacterized protein (DUF305 family)